ncbi:Transmembrane protein 53-like protein [Drosera capensis]
MEESVRLLHLTLNRHQSLFFSPKPLLSPRLLKTLPRRFPISLSSIPKNPNPNHNRFFLSLTSPPIHRTRINQHPKPNIRGSNPFNLGSHVWCNDGGSIDWYEIDRGNERGSVVEKERKGDERDVMVVLLGWLGATPRHLMKYAEIYVGRGCGVVTFAVSVSNVLWLDLGRGIEERVEALVGRLVDWLEEEDGRGRERYGSILCRLQSRPDILDKIRGCIVDSGAAPELSPQVWAAGFAAAMLKKRGPAVHPSAEAGELSIGTMLKAQEDEKSIIEILLLFIFESIFSFLLQLPDVNRRLSKILFILSESQPPCPQLYLYSTADKVIPFRSVESFIKEQRKIGKEVQSFNFVSSPHVDHYRRFPDLYTSKVIDFLNLCLDAAKQR